MSNILIAAPGLRDPFVPNNHDVRPEAAPSKHQETIREMERVAVAFENLPELKTLEERASPGPLMTALYQMNRTDWVPDVVLLLFRADALMSPRVGLLQRVGPTFLNVLSGREAKIWPRGDLPDVFEFGGTWNGIRDVLRGDSDLFEPESGNNIRILLGPGTPALSFGLLLLPYSLMPQATIWQIKHPEMVRRSANPAFAESGVSLIELPMDGICLPHLSLDGGAAPAVRELRCGLDRCEDENRRLRAELSSLQIADGDQPEFESFEACERWYCQRLIAKGDPSGKKLTQERAANLHGDITRPGFQEKLKRLGIQW